MGEGRPRPALARDFPAMYASLYPKIASVGRACGYAIALHGSLGRDMDLIAAPWTEEACPPEELIWALYDDLAVYEDFLGDDRPGLGRPEVKPHGRMGWSLILRAGAYIDISIMPRRNP